MEIVKIPVPVPVAVLLSEVVGFWFVAQQIPLAVTVAPPSEVTSPPKVADVAVILVIAEIVTVGAVFMASFLQLNKVVKSNPIRKNL